MYDLACAARLIGWVREPPELDMGVAQGETLSLDVTESHRVEGLEVGPWRAAGLEIGVDSNDGRAPTQTGMELWAEVERSGELEKALDTSDIARGEDINKWAAKLAADICAVEYDWDKAFMICKETGVCGRYVGSRIEPIPCHECGKPASYCLEDGWTCEDCDALKPRGLNE